MSEKLQMVCSHCGSADVGADASARWNAETQQWELSATYDKGSSCEVCEGECRIDEIPFDEWQANLTQPEEFNSDLIDDGPLTIAIIHVGAEDDDKWLAQVSKGDDERFRGTIIHATPEDAKDAARRWCIFGKETGSY